MRAIGPLTPICDRNSSLAGPTGTLPGDVRKPKTLFHPAGLRSEPHMSLPSATGSMSSATATAAPPLDPPELSRWSKALRVVPNTSL